MSRARRVRGGLLAGVLLLPGGLLVLPSGAQAASGDCVQSGLTVTCTYTHTGAEQTFTVPAGVTSVHVRAVGGSGGENSTLSDSREPGLGPRSSGAAVEGELATLTPGQVLYVEVGGSGTAVVDPSGPPFNGGGLAGNDSGSGGGASDVRSTSMTVVPNSALTDGNDSRLIVAGGGGGGGALLNCGNGGAGGNAGAPGADGTGCAAVPPGAGGRAGTQDAGGSGATNPSDPTRSGAAGVRGQGGKGGPFDGGGGGGGLFGGGGGAGHVGFFGGSGGGGGGSSLVPLGGSGPTLTDEAAQVVISYTAPLASPEITASSGDGQSAQAGAAFAQPLVATLSVGDAPVPLQEVTFTVTSGSASFPSGSSATSTTGTDGTATSPVLTAGSSPGQVVVTASSTTASDGATFDLTVTGSAPTVGGTPPPGTVGVPYDFTFATMGSPDPTVSVTSGSLPAGLSLSDGGRLSGTPTAAGDSTYEVTASNAVGSASTEVTTTISPAPQPAGWPASVSGFAAPRAGAAKAYYLGVVGDAWKLVVTQPAKRGTSFTGSVTVDQGSFSRVSRIRNEGTDTFSVDGRTISFRFRNFSELDGLAFTTPSAATSVTFRLDVAGQPAVAQQILTGRPRTVSPTGSPITYQRATTAD